MRGTVSRRAGRRKYHGAGFLQTMITPNTTSTAETLPTLPALKHLGDLAGIRPVVICDTREQTPLPILRLPVIRGTLTTGDYSFSGGQELFSIERKTVADLIGCCCGESRERFERELHRLRGFRFKRLLIVGARAEIEAGTYRGNVKPAAVLNSLSAWECRHDCPVVFEATPAAAGRRVESWAFWYAREIVENSNALLRGMKA